MYEYIDEVEKDFFAACQLDENPKICINPVEESTYLGVSLYTSEEGYQSLVENLFNKTVSYLDIFIQNNSFTDQSYIFLTLNRLIGKYQTLQEQFNNSTIRLSWHSQSYYSSSSNSTSSNLNLIQSEKYTKEAYLFFFRMSSAQRWYIEKMVEYLLLQKSSFNYPIPVHVTNQKNECFKLNESIIDADGLLEFIFDRLTANKYIICTKKEFKKLFNRLGDVPTPIIWSKEYNYLTYFIKQLSKRIIKKHTAPSHYELASKLFYEKQAGVHFTNTKLRHDKDPENQIFIKTINGIIIHAEGAYLPKPTPSEGYKLKHKPLIK